MALLTDDQKMLQETAASFLREEGSVAEQLRHWRATAMLGYIAFAWSWPDGSPAMWLANQPALQHQLAAENGS